MHPTDGALLALLDEWIDPLEQGQIERHVDGCERCREDMARLERERLVVSTLLQEVAASVPARFVDTIVRRARQSRSRRRELIAAAAALFIVTAAGATIRSGGVHEILRRFTSPSPPATAPARRTPPTAEEGLSGVTLDPTNNVEIDFAAAQPEGELRIVLGEGPRITVTASAAVPYALRSGKVAVANQGARASYHVVLPRDLERVSIRVAGQVIFAKWQSTIVTEATREGVDSFRVPLAQRKGAPR
jgi:hypothetical protein